MEKLIIAQTIRAKNFSNEFLLSYPQNTESISVTGSACALKCAHCGGHYLSRMTAIDSLNKSDDIKGTSCLISGGCDKDGKVLVTPHLQKLANIKGDKRYNFHVGLLNEEEIKQIAPLADVVSFDFLGADSTIKETLKLDKKVADYIECYRNLRKYCHVVAPHICIGLENGQIKGEYNALELIANENPELLIFIVLIPTKDTEYEKCMPPILEEVKKFLLTARLRLPLTKLILGCMRPGGNYRQELDCFVVEAGFNGIVQPTKKALVKAEQMGLKFEQTKECCVL